MWASSFKIREKIEIQVAIFSASHFADEFAMSCYVVRNSLASGGDANKGHVLGKIIKFYQRCQEHEMFIH